MQMSFRDRKYTLPLVGLLVVLGAVYWWADDSNNDVSQERMLQWIQEGYPSQFCTNIYPRLADCLTFGVSDCEKVAEQQVQPCIDQVIDTMPQSASPAEAKKIYETVSACFQGNMHEELSNKYLKDTTECKKRME